MTTETPTPRGPLVALLAAGSARRFGGAKLDAPLGVRPLGHWALAAAVASGLDVAIVVGREPPRFALDAQTSDGVRLIENPAVATGMGSSVACAARAAIAGCHSGLIILLADMPFVTDDRLPGLIDPDRAVFARHASDVAGPPAWIPSALLPRLTHLTGEIGARSVLGAGDIRLIDWPARQLMDIDTAQSLDRARAIVASLIPPGTPR